jgi:molybdopterin synthase catalytic subunit
MSKVSVLFFASLKDRAGIKNTILEVPDGTRVAELKTILGEQYPDLKPALGSALISINREYAFETDLIPSGAEIGIFPPVSGGDLPTIIAVVEGEINLNQILTQITLPTTGAACFFTGMVRKTTRRDDPHETIYLEYEAYLPMAEAKMRQVADEIRLRWSDVEGIAMVQRIGHLEPGTPTVLIACTAAHRDSGVFEAARYGIDRLKEIVPVWKKEVGPQGETWVEGVYYPMPDDKLNPTYLP